MSALPPVAKAALLFACGVASSRFGVVSLAPLGVLLFLPAPNFIWRRPGERVFWAMLVAAGVLSGLRTGPHALCGPALGPSISGRFLAAPRGGIAPFRADALGCEIRVVLTGQAPSPGVGAVVSGAWIEGRRGHWFRATSVRPSSLEGWRWAPVRWRGRIANKLHEQYGARGAIASALILARREGLDPDLREGFARAGIAHLLAISGFHVGVIAGMMLALLRVMRVPRRRAALIAAGLTWVYVGLIGFPAAASRAALISTLLALSRARGRPAARWGALGSAFLFLALQDAGRVAEAGFQLSFAGAAGLVAWAGGLDRALRRGWGRHVPRAMTTAVAAGIAATAATLPIAAWHFERISVVGIPATLVASPLVATAVPAAIAALLLDGVWETGGRFLAGGVDVLLAALEGLTLGLSALDWASVWVSRSTVGIAVLGAAVGSVAVRHRRLRSATRRVMVLIWGVIGVTVWPMLAAVSDRASVEIIALDVGQGDAIAIRTPGSRWVLIDAGPPSRDAGAPAAAVRELAALQVSRIELLLFTHPDVDHIGGAVGVMNAVSVGSVLDPARPAGKAAYVELLEEAAGLGVPWRGARAGDSWTLDGVRFEVLAPPEDQEGSDADTNTSSLVVLVSYGSFEALLTGDAPAAVEREIAPSILMELEVLKVGHHGSDTSTDPELLRLLHPRVALVSVGRRNRYGHPHPAVLDRLESAGVQVYRTDREGRLSVRGRRDGSFRVRTARQRASRR